MTLTVQGDVTTAYFELAEAIWGTEHEDAMVDHQDTLKRLRAIVEERNEFHGDYAASKARIEADCLFLAAKETSKWTRRCDDAKRIPDVLHEMAHAKQEEAGDH